VPPYWTDQRQKRANGINNQALPEFQEKNYNNRRKKRRRNGGDLKNGKKWEVPAHNGALPGKEGN